MDRFRLKEEMKKAGAPYDCWLEHNEWWRGKSVPHDVMNSFMKKYTFRYSGRYVNDPDLYERFALYAAHGDFDIIYCDEDVVMDGKRQFPFFKPDFSPDTLESINYFGDFLAVSSDYLAREKKGDTSLSPERVCHIPEVLYHSMVMPEYSRLESSDDSEDSDLFVDRFDDSVSIIVLSKDHPDMLLRCVSTLIRSGLPDNTELIVIDNGSTGDNRTKYDELAAGYGFRYYYLQQAFNYSELCNRGAAMARGRFLLFMNDDVEVPEALHEAVSEMCRKAARPYAGAVGIKLLYPDSRKIQHCGITMLKNGPAHKLCGYDDRVSWYFGYNKNDIDVMAVTGACMCIEKSKFDAAGGFDCKLPLAYNDVDLCIRLLERGLYNISMNSMHMFHHESATRTDDRNDAAAYHDLVRYREYLYEKHSSFMEKGDPFYSRNLTQTGLDFRPQTESAADTAGVETEPLRLKAYTLHEAELQSKIDSFDYKVSDVYGNEDFREVRGWIMKKGSSPAGSEPALMVSCGGDKLLFRAEWEFRKDVGEAFPKRKYACMSGFVARIAEDVLDRKAFHGKCEISPAVIRGRKIYKDKNTWQTEMI